MPYPIFCGKLFDLVEIKQIIPARSALHGQLTGLRQPRNLALLHRKTLCYSKSLQMLKYSIRILLFYLKFKTLPVSA